MTLVLRLFSAEVIVPGIVLYENTKSTTPVYLTAKAELLTIR